MANHAMYGSNKYSEENNNVVLFSQDYGTAGATHTNSTDAADLFSYSIPANTLEVGDVVKIKVYATVTDNNSTESNDTTEDGKENIIGNQFAELLKNDDEVIDK